MTSMDHPGQVPVEEVDNMIYRLCTAEAHHDTDLVVDNHEGLDMDSAVPVDGVVVHKERSTAELLDHYLMVLGDDTHARDHLLRQVGEDTASCLDPLEDNLLLHARCTTLLSDESPRCRMIVSTADVAQGGFMVLDCRDRSVSGKKKRMVKMLKEMRKRSR